MIPRSQERAFDRGYAPELLRIAEQDLSSGTFAAGGVRSGRVRPENVLFLFHQCIEKVLKVALVHLDIPVPLVHDLSVRIAELPDEHEPAFGYELLALNEIAGVRCYEEGGMVYEEADLDDARVMAHGIVAWGRSILGGSSTR